MGYRVLRPAANAAISPLPSSISSSFIPSGRPGGTRIHPLGMLLASALWLGGNPSLSAAQAAVTPPAKASTAPASTAPSNREPAPTSASSAPEAKPASLANSGILTAPPGFNTSARTADVLAHLSAVIRFYRTAVVPIQTVGEPSDLLYREQTVTYSSQIANLAFQSAKAEASLIEQIQKLGGKSSSTTAETETQRLQANRNTVAEQIAALKDQDAALTKALVNARAKDRPALEGEQSRVEGALELQTQMADALGKVASMADSRSQSGLVGDVDRLQHSAPELADTKTKTVTAPLESLSSAHDAGVSSQASVLFRLLGTRHSIENLISENDALQKQTTDLRTPLIQVLRATIQQGQTLSQQATNPAPPPSSPTPAPAPTTAALTEAQTLAATRKQFDSLTATFKALSAAAVPLSQEIVTLEQNRANLASWRTAVNTEYNTILRDLLLRVLAIAIALGIIFGLGEVWRRATTRYVKDIRRRRQLLVMRRLVTGFLSGIVVIFGLVTQFNSLATFAGFITAGLAVGLQTILLSVAAYFFIIGRFGVRVGDRITVAGVTGDVIDVGLVRFYILELAGSAVDLHPTGRVAVFSNAVLFQAGTPLYKQMPGTEYAWHELTVKLSLTSDYRRAANTMLASVQTIYDRYRPQIERQHGDLQSWMDASIDAPKIESHLQLVDDGLQFWVRFPVEIRNASAVDEEVTNSVLQLMTGDEQVKTAVTAPPVIKGVVKG